MSVGTTLEQTAIMDLVELWGHGNIFYRIMDEIKRTNAAMPNATGTDKRHKFLAGCKIIFDDLVEPVGEHVLRKLLELGIDYLEARGET